MLSSAIGLSIWLDEMLLKVSECLKLSFSKYRVISATAKVLRFLAALNGLIAE